MPALPFISEPDLRYSALRKMRGKEPTSFSVWRLILAGPGDRRGRDDEPDLLKGFTQGTFRRAFQPFASATGQIPMVWKRDVRFIVAQNRQQVVAEKERQFRSAKIGYGV